MINSMDFTEFQDLVNSILEAELPQGKTIVKEGRELAKQIVPGRTLFLDHRGVDSEAEYKRRCIKENRITYHAHVGLNSWRATVDALEYLYQFGKKSDSVIDRAGICLDRSMGLPREIRSKIPAETGPVMEKPEDWQQVGQVVPVQPHMGDFMIGFPASTENTILALKAGVTTIGNLSQFFAHNVPTWNNHEQTSIETVRAISILSTFRDKGMMLHSYLEDGYGALFTDSATIAGWAFLERYIVEELIGAKLTHCIGGLTTDPVKRAGWIFALDKIHENDCVGSMIYGDTISFTNDFTINRVLVSEYLMWDIMAQLECPTGHAALPLPVTEAHRIPSAEEILEAQVLGRRVEQTARRLYPHMDFSPAKEFAEKITTEGDNVFKNSLDGLKEAGVNIQDPLEMLYVLKQMGLVVFEEMFGAGIKDKDSLHGRRPVVITDIFEASFKCLKSVRSKFAGIVKGDGFKKARLLIASTDVHEHAIIIIRQLMEEMGNETVYLGAEQDPDQVAKAALENNVDGILLSTHNGMARDYAIRLQEELFELNIDVPVVMGGVLNQKVDNKELPVDVTNDIKKLGIFPAVKLENQLPDFLNANKV